MNVSYIPSTEKGPKKEMKISFLVLVLFGLSKKYFFEVVMEMMHIPSGDNDDDAEDDEAGASPLAGNCGGADVEIFRSIRGSAHLSFSSFSFSSAFSYISNFSQSPHVPILLLNAITFRVGHRLPHVVRQTLRYPIHVILTSQNLHLDKMASWHLKKGSLIRNSWYPTPAFQPSWTVATGQHLLN